MKIFYLGPEGTNSDLACRAIFDDSYSFIPTNSIEDIFEKVALSHSYYGVIPFENSYQGVINSSLNSLIDYDLKIIKEYNFAISHHLCSQNTNFKYGDIKLIVSHAQVFGQCNNWLRANIPNAERKVVTSTAEAAYQASVDSDIFCIANSYAIQLNGLNKNAENIQDRDDNKTRFLVLGKMLEGAGKKNKTSIMVNIKDEPGSLLKILKPFSDLNINMTRIETRPSRNNTFHHTFFIDFEGFFEEKNNSKLIEILDSLSEELRIIGSYPVLN